MKGNKNKSGGLRALRKTIEEILLLNKEHIFPALDTLPPKALISPLRTLFLSKNELLRWRSITAFGYVMSKIAQRNVEDARIVMRQLMWTLNDESGGIGWGSPEAMGESMATTRILCEEYGRILLSYIWEEGNYLEYPHLRTGALWGIMRATLAHPDLMTAFCAKDYLVAYLDEEEEEALGLTLLTLTALKEHELVNKTIEERDLHQKRFRIYLNGEFTDVIIGSIPTLQTFNPDA
ncbi:hypothetical protein DBT_1948 [Dissulfuribacter thermophilus]|uniref:HEAT repeat domain-containing protein n=1 Tax=Dissulfuribacter thermophilus TaxID=1156395 RepID=A0A1B9F450_9BACT|nr:DVU0298 family protein [Dissulfuribacter thermophilus]OCC14633.1 hypothetical protein DBT_1948 [Dissulfuribacter thermophilus]